MQTLIGIAACIVLFVIYGLARQRGCAGNCGSCTSACGRTARSHHHV